MRKVVLDTDVLISGVIALGYSASILNAVRRAEIQLVISSHLLAEFSEVISRRHIARKYPKASENAEALLDYLRAFATLTPGIPEPRTSAPTATMILFSPARWMKKWTLSFQVIHTCWI